ncbi:MAG: ribosomal protein S18-alanine N-acetyltransferase [Chloroflexi bacterium]|nr:ribosomal protein S18-alanine N-acetyltransferase [Chloroflexota bacterium]
MRVAICRMRRGDISGVQAIERQVFPCPWSRATFEREVESSDFHYLIVAKAGDRMVGYACFFHVLDEGHVTNIGVDPEFQSHGIGTQLMYAIVCYAAKKGIRRLMLEVRPTNAVAQRLYRKFGFFQTGVRRGYYTDTREDAYIFWTGDIRSDSYKQLFSRIGERIKQAA